MTNYIAQIMNLSFNLISHLLNETCILEIFLNYFFTLVFKFK